MSATDFSCISVALRGRETLRRLKRSGAPEKIEIAYGLLALTDLHFTIFYLHW
jgi:hypothetical protein